MGFCDHAACMATIPVMAGVVGWPIGHSRSPALHQFWLRQYGLNGQYLPFAVPPSRLETAVRGAAALGLRGLTVTIPHKETVLPYMDRVDDLARRIGAVNHIVVGPDGLLEGHNTACTGFREALRHVAPAFSATQGPITIIGAGGGGRAVAAALAQLGCPEIRLVNRTTVRAELLAADLEQYFSTNARIVSWQQREEALRDAAMLVHLTTLGMVGRPPLSLSLANLPPQAVVAEGVYDPLETPLLSAARARGHLTIDGLSLLIQQARPAFRAWFGIDPNVSPELRQQLQQAA